MSTEGKSTLPVWVLYAYYKRRDGQPPYYLSLCGPKSCRHGKSSSHIWSCKCPECNAPVLGLDNLLGSFSSNEPHYKVPDSISEWNRYNIETTKTWSFGSLGRAGFVKLVADASQLSNVNLVRIIADYLAAEGASQIDGQWLQLLKGGATRRVTQFYGQPLDSVPVELRLDRLIDIVKH